MSAVEREKGSGQAVEWGNMTESAREEWKDWERSMT